MATLLDLAKLSAAAHGGSPVPAGWTLIAESNPLFNTRDGYYGAAYKNVGTGEIVIANRGTRFPNFTDLWTDTQLAVQAPTASAADAIQFAIQVARNNRKIRRLDRERALETFQRLFVAPQALERARVVVVNLRAPGTFGRKLVKAGQGIFPSLALKVPDGEPHQLVGVRSFGSLAWHATFCGAVNTSMIN
jgi:hypothetical protein